MIAVRRFAIVLFLTLGVCTAALAGAVDGTVKNGTTGKASVGATVTLIQLQGTMQPVANTKTDAAGHYHFDQPEIGSGPMLLRVTYNGVNYFEPLMPGKTNVDIQVYDSTDKPGSVQVSTHAIIIQPDGDQLKIGEEYTIENHTNPPVAYYKDGGTFEFTIPENVKLGEVSAWSAAGMPVVQQTIDKGKNARAVSFPFKPGENGVRLAYNVPYTGNKATIRTLSPYSTEHVIVAAPPGMQISGSGLAPGGSEQGFEIFGRDQLAANMPMDISVSGVAPPVPPSAASAAPGDNGADSADANGSAQDPSVNSRVETSEPAAVLPARLDSLKWVFVACFGALFALGALLISRRPQYVAAAATQFSAAGNGNTSIVPPAPAAKSSAGPAEQIYAQAESKALGSLDSLKDQIFRLELRHQAGTITEEDYLRQRAQVEKSLRDLVQG